MSARRALILCLLVSSVASCAHAPILTDSQKLLIRDAQIKVAILDAKKIRAESEYRDVSAQLKQAAQELDTTVAKFTPKGYSIQMDLTLSPEKK